jgi:HEPN domain-containing protein
VEINAKIQEWLRQSEYDISTAEFMYSGGRCFYAVFMCHLAIEKLLKGLLLSKLQELPPKTHNLIYLLDKIGIRPEKNLGKFIAKLNEVSIATRYPEDVEKLQKIFTDDVTKQIISQTKETLEWIKKQF